MNHNPYAAPESSVDPVTEPGNFELHEPRGVSAGRGLSWISEGFGFFREAVGGWLAICLVGFVVLVVVSLLPIVNILSGLLSYVWIGGLMLACKSQDDNEGVSVAHLFAGFQNRFGSLVLLSVIYLVITIAIFAVAFGSVYAEMFALGMQGADPDEFNNLILDDPLGSLVLPFLLALLVFVPAIMAFWFAPALIVINDLSVTQAMKMSFMGCLKNVAPYLLYGVVMLVLFFVASIPFGLGLLVLAPTSIASIYCAYKDIYINVD